MPKRPDLKKVLVIGSGPIIIGQAAEFDYSGTQACRALREEGVQVVLVNSNPATVMTDTETADRVYIEPLTVDFLTRVIERERPDALLPTLGGQVGLNAAMDLIRAGVLDRFGVEVIGTPPATIEKAEDREQFAKLMDEIGEPIAAGTIARSVDEALAFAAKVGYPLVVRPAYTLGGTGGGIVTGEEELIATVRRGLSASPVGQVLIEESLIGWKEIEFEVMRDAADQCITICSLENIDPMGIHTGDSIVVAPTLTLPVDELRQLRTSAHRIIRALGVEGGCNVQFALRPDGKAYRVIEVNPRVSRSSALASKATGYPIAKIAAKVALGLRLDEIPNPLTRATSALMEPSIDYVVVKIPRWPFDKFMAADRRLGTQMKATGEVMAVERTLEAALQKAIRSLEIGLDGLVWPEAAGWTDQQLLDAIANQDDRRMFLLGEALRRGIPQQRLVDLTLIDPYFIEKLNRIVRFEERLRTAAALTPELLREAKRMGFSDRRIGELRGGVTAEAIRQQRLENGIVPTYKQVDTGAGVYDPLTPYLYATYEQEDERRTGDRQRVLVLGSGPIRIGQGIEFDYCSVHAVQTLRRLGYEAIIVNNNPETVSTDFDTADRLYFDPLTVEDVLNVIDGEQPYGVITQFGGQTAINLAQPLAAAGVPMLGTSPDAIDQAETRERFDQLLDDLQIARPQGGAAASTEAAIAIAERIGYPVMVRPSYVLGGRAMQVASNQAELDQYLAGAVEVNREKPVWIDQYISGIELEVDAISDGDVVVLPGIMKHVERAGVHSGDSIAVFPARDLPRAVEEEVAAVTIRIARALRVKGIINLQLVYDRNRLYVLEVNPRASRTVPFMAKATGIPLIDLATRVAVGASLRDLGWETGLVPPPDHISVKLPVFSWSKLPGVDAGVGPEMSSTGEVMAIDQTLEAALAKGLIAAGYRLPRPGEGVLFTVADAEKPQAIKQAQRLAALGYKLYATEGTARALRAAGLDVTMLKKINEPSPNLLDALRDGAIQMVINAITQGKQPERDGFRIRRSAVEHGIPCFTSMDTAEAVVQILDHFRDAADRPPRIYALQDLSDAPEALPS